MKVCCIRKDLWKRRYWIRRDRGSMIRIDHPRIGGIVSKASHLIQNCIGIELRWDPIMIMIGIYKSYKIVVYIDFNLMYLLMILVIRMGRMYRMLVDYQVLGLGWNSELVCLSLFCCSILIVSIVCFNFSTFKLFLIF